MKHVRTKVDINHLTCLAQEIVTMSRAEHDTNVFVRNLFAAFRSYIEISSGIVNLCVIDDRLRLVDLESYLYNQPKNIKSRYKKIFAVDFFSPHLINEQRRLLDATDYIDPSSIEHSDYFKSHLRHFDIGNGMGFAVPFPGQYRKWIMFYILVSEIGKPFPEHDKILVDRLLEIIYVALLHSFGTICGYTMETHAALRVKFLNSPQQLNLLRLVMKKPFAKSHEYASLMSVSPRTIEHELDIIYEKLGACRYGKNKKLEALQRLQVFSW